MKRYIIIIVQLFMVVTIHAQTYKYTLANLNLRSAPNISSKVLTVIPFGTSVEMAESCECVWIKVSYKGNIGYVSSKYLTNQNVSSKTSNNIYDETHTNSTVKYYINTKGQKVQSPTYYKAPPAGATALCRDGTYSFSKNRRGTCSHHGGVSEWLK